MASPASFRRRRLARELRQLREARHLTSDAVVGAADISQSSLSRIENAVVRISPNTVKSLLDVYGVTGEQRDALLALAREANRQSWWHAYGDVLPEWFEVYVDLEAEADTLDVYDNQVVNGLLQTEEYARALLSMCVPGAAPEEIERRVEVRMQRQARVTGGALRLCAVVDECVLHRMYGSASIMSAQIDRLISMASLGNVSIQVLPAGSPVGVLGSFSILEFSVTDPVVVYLENEIGALYLEKPEQARHYSRLYDRLRAAALGPEASITRLAQLKE